MRNPFDDLQHYLTLTVGGVFWVDRLPDAPDAATVIRPYLPDPPGYVHNQRTPVLEMTRIQVVTRDVDFPTAWEQARKVITALSEVVNVEIDGAFYQGVRPLSGLFPIPNDDDDERRVLVACNYQIMKEW